MEPFKLEVDDITEHNIVSDFVGMVIKARNEAIKRGIKADSIVINKNHVFVPGAIDLYPAMVCGLNVYVTKDELPDGYSFAVVESQREKTNADRIRAMSDEELAEFLCGVYDDDNCGVYQDECGKFINGTIIIDYDQNKLLEWLQQPAEGD